MFSGPLISSRNILIGWKNFQTVQPDWKLSVIPFAGQNLLEKPRDRDHLGLFFAGHFLHIRRVKEENQRMFGKSKWKERASELELSLRKAQEYITDILTYHAGEKAQSASAGINPYNTRDKLVAELVRKYKGYAASGNQLIQRIVDTRAAFTMAGGLKPVSRDQSAEAELAFIREMIELNELDGQFGQQLAVEKELEGQILLTLEWDPEVQNMRIKFISWNDTHYEATYRDNFYHKIDKIVYTAPDDTDWDRQVEIPARSAVFIKFNARINSREGVPTLSGLLAEAEDIDRALRDWRRLNQYFASPTPFFRTRDMQEARDLYNQLLSPGINWRIGKVFAGPAEFSLVETSGAGAESIRLEIETKIKVLAGGSGVPVQFLGFPEFMSNRATAENSMEPVALVSISEQRSWVQGFKELFDKAIILRNEMSSPLEKPLRAGVIDPKMKFTTQAQVDRLIALYYPLWQSGGINLKTLLALLPDIDAEAETENFSSATEGD
jgi:hypothetical protein